MKNILLINPPFPMEERYHRAFKQVGTMLPKLGILYVASALENAGYKVSILDAALEKINILQTSKKASNLSPDIVGITTETANIKRSVRLAEEIKKRINATIVFGGPHPTLLPKEVLSHDSIDYVVIGEGEITIVELLETLKNNNKLNYISRVKGIGYKENGNIIITEKRARIKNLDHIKFPARHLIDITRYKPTPHQYKRLPVVHMIASRGCPFRCTYCSASNIWERKYTARSVDNVIEEIVYAKEKLGAREITFWDDIWGLKKDWAEEFCEKIIKGKIDIIWSCECRVDSVSESLLKRMAEAGCWKIFYGLESLDEEILSAIKKDIRTSKIYDAIMWTKASGIEVHGNFILGLPKESPAKVRKMIKKICELPLDYVKFNVLTPYPGTVLYEQIKNGQWGDYVENFRKLTLHHVTFKPFGYKSFDEIDEMRKYATKRFYLRPNYIINRLCSIRTLEDVQRNYRGLMTILNL